MSLSQFHHQISGNSAGNKLVFLHGLMGSGANWRRILPAFEADFQVLVYDQRGHGRSMQPQSGYRPSDFAEDLRRILDELGWDKISLIGHSMGGRNALEFLQSFPRRTKRLVIEDIGPGGEQTMVNVIERLLERVPTPFASRIEAREFFLNRYEQLIAFHPQPHVISKFLYANLEEKPNGQWDWRFFKPGILETLRVGHERSRWDLVESISIPTLWLRGEHSTDLRRSAFEEILRRNPYIQGMEISAAGHWIHFDQPDAFIKAVKDFLTLPADVV